MRQGCVMGSLGFCAGVLDLYKAAIAQVPGSAGVAIIDNFTLLGPLEALKPAAEYVIRHAPDSGGQIKLDKCSTHYFGDQPASAAEWSEELGIRVNTHATEYLGGFLGSDEAEMEAMAMRKAQEIAACARKLTEPGLPRQIALLLLFSCIPSRFDHLARLCRPEVLRKAAKWLDGEMVEVYCQLTGISRAEITPEVRRLLFAPRSLGGRGLRSCEELLERSYLGSQALSAPLLQPALDRERADSVRRVAIESALAGVQRQMPKMYDQLLPVTVDTFSSYFAEDGKERRKQRMKLQKDITGAVRAELEGKLRAEAKTVRDKALLRACTAPGAKLAFTTTPHARHLALNDRQISINERLHLGLPPEQQMPLHCACYARNGQYGADPWHGLSCQSQRATSVTDRHDDVKLAIARWASRLGARVKIEPRRLDERGRDGGPKSQKRPDLWIEIAGQCYLLDVTVRHPLAPSHVDDCAKDGKKILEDAEAEKQRVYRGLAENMRAKFFAFAVETTGRLGKEALAFIKILIREGAKYKNVWAPKEVVEGIYRTVAIAVARGNADIVDSNLRHSRIAAWE